MSDSAFSIVQAYQEEYGWNDDTMLQLFIQWVDDDMLHADLAEYLAERAADEDVY